MENFMMNTSMKLYNKTAILWEVIEGAEYSQT